MTRAEAKQYDTFVIGIFKSGKENFSLVGYAMNEVLILLSYFLKNDDKNALHIYLTDKIS